ncbi:MAG: integral rane sensor signal transduction histidine kinase, partial [Verrucomicrobiales bacterium]|nr:integral rane sensor signal transduction histidine kinase [Verrucomicrobiales bacterium]
ELVGDAAEDAQFLANPHGIRVETVLPDQPVRIMGDRHRLRQLMLNLVDNAVKYNQSGGFVRISLSKTREEACLEIVNPGNGIPEAMAGRVFERFFRVDSSHSQTVEGSGLGLNIAQWIVQCHGGDLSLLTGADGLTRATVRLPKKLPAAAMNAQPSGEGAGLAGLAAGA